MSEWMQALPDPLDSLDSASRREMIEQSRLHERDRDLWMQRIAALEAQLVVVEKDRDRWLIENNQNLMAVDRMVRKHDTLQAALKACAEAGDVMSMLFEAHWTVKDTHEAVHEAVENWKKALANPVVKAVLSQKGGDADGKEEAR